jgi:hypothetical protein
MPTQEEALEAAKLAAMIGGQLKAVDNMTVERRNSPANKINIQEFVNRIKNPNASSRASDYLTYNDQGFAGPPPEEYIQSVVPDIQPSFIPQPPAPQPPIQQPVSQPPPQPPVGSVNLPHIVNPRQTSDIKLQSSVLTRSDVDSIRNSLKNIDKSLAGLLSFFKNSKLSSTNE